jgi:putative restriction endonuclease
MFLVNKAKGIHKPAQLNHALSVRQSLGGPYEDALQWLPDGTRFFKYAQEGNDPEYFTNCGLRTVVTAKRPLS